MSQMPPLKHTLVGRSELIEWVKKTFDIDDAMAAAVFSSAKQSKYIIQSQGRWSGDAASGYRYWKNGGKSGAKQSTKKLPSSSELVNPNTNPEFFNLYGKVAGAAFSRGSGLSIDEVQEMCNRMWEGDPLRSVRQKQAMRVYRTYLKAKAQEEQESEPEPQEP
jgi:hypothetical protein